MTLWPGAPVLVGVVLFAVELRHWDRVAAVLLVAVVVGLLLGVARGAR